MKRFLEVDKPLLFCIITLILSGLFIFSSAALGILAKREVTFYNILLNQLIFALTAGMAALLLGGLMPYRKLRSFAIFIFFVSVVAGTLPFIPDLGISHGGATRWVSLFGFSVQPGEVLKLGTVILLAAWFATYRHKIERLSYGLVPFILIIGITGTVFMLQPDLGTFLTVLGASIAIYLASGAKFTHLFSLAALATLGLTILAQIRPYVKDRLLTFLDPSHDPLGASYQIKQSLIAVGSGGVTGQGFGQSVQKFSFLPEPVGDSIFAVIGEELGLVGSSIIIFLFVFLALRAISIAKKTNDSFGGLLMVGVAMLLVTQAFLNIGSMLGVTPLTGVPLPFISHGGTALVINLFEAGLLLNISRGVS